MTVQLRYGSLPTPSFIADACRAKSLSVDTVLRALRSNIRHGHMELALNLLNALGLDWTRPACCGRRICECVDAAQLGEEVDAVARALATLGAADNDNREPR